jgi:hypothetical protein
LLSQNGFLLTHFGIFSKQKQLLLSQTGVCLLISVYSASKSNYCFLKLGFAYSFRYIQQAKATIAFSNWGLLSYLRNFITEHYHHCVAKTIRDLQEFSQAD